MIKKPFFGFTRPKLRYAEVEDPGQFEVQDIPLPEKITLTLSSDRIHYGDLNLRQGAEVKTGERVPLLQGRKGYLASPVTGTVERVSENTTFTDYRSIFITIDVADKDRWDTEFSKAVESPSPQVVREFLALLPGMSNFTSLIHIENPLNIIVVNGMDQDLLVSTNQWIVHAEAQGIKEGLDYLKTVTGASRVVLVVPPNLRSQAEKTGAEIKVIRPVYPNALPRFTVREILGRDIPANAALSNFGVGVISAEAVLALKTAFVDKRPPVEKMVSVIHKDGRVRCVRARIGTPVREILSALDISVDQGDRIVFGGPMTGHSVYSEDMPIMHSTDAILIQDKNQVIPNSDNPCVNCGECVRACPAKLPVNMLIRLLENRLYEEAAQVYDLFSCVECGLCSYVCPLHIPVFHYIMLGKHELGLEQAAEESDGEQ